MYLSRSAEKAIVQAAHRPDEPPFQVADPSKQRELLADWSEQISRAYAHCTPRISPPLEGILRLSIYVRVDAPAARYHDTNYILLDLQFVDHVLCYWGGSPRDIKVPISGIDHVFRLIDGAKKRLLELRANEQKQKKVKELKTRAIETQVEGLAQRLQFAYRLKRMHTKVVLIVQLDKRQSLFVDIPLGKIQQSIDRIEPLVRHVRELYDEGLRFKIAVSPHGDFRQPNPAE